MEKFTSLFFLYLHFPIGAWFQKLLKAGHKMPVIALLGRAEMDQSPSPREAFMKRGSLVCKHSILWSNHPNPTEKNRTLLDEKWEILIHHIYCCHWITGLVLFSLFLSLSLLFCFYNNSYVLPLGKRGWFFFFFGWILLSTCLTVNLDMHCLDFFLCCLDHGKA